MPIDPNEIGGFVSSCTNEGYLLGLRAHLDARIAFLRGGRSATPPESLTAEQIISDQAETPASDMLVLEAVGMDYDGQVKPVAELSEPAEPPVETPAAESMDASGSFSTSSVASPGDGAEEEKNEPEPSRAIMTEHEIDLHRKTRRARTKKK